jgi:hypothetical protein
MTRISDKLAKDWPLPDAFLVELGRMSAVWASLESQLNISVAKLAGFDDWADPTSLILLTHSSFPQRLDMLGALCEQLSPHAPNLSGYKEVISLLRSAQTSRNRHMHNGMFFEAGRCFITEGSARGKVKTSVKPITISELRNVSESIHLAMLALHKLITKVTVPPMWERSNA